ncbi:hypothetical protein COCNU_09G009330 [Cocos nucifera]|uniref:Uncharacterized protein n=1 Tax=Cocos nucifera TaxID=13894 RepID=A0A8K0N7M2_COCNU|nr:hypothetical protein COCNU_09G009330 [Cocos nucifera]
MASSPTSLLHPLPRAPRPAAVRCLAGPASLPQPPAGRRQCLLLLLLSSPAPLLAGAAPARAQDIPLFGLRKRLKKIEEEAEEIVKEGEKAVEEGFVAAEKEIQAAEEGIAAEAGVGVAGDLLQAGAVVGAEAVGVLVGVSVVNGILGPERQKP